MSITYNGPIYGVWNIWRKPILKSIPGELIFVQEYTRKKIKKYVRPGKFITNYNKL